MSVAGLLPAPRDPVRRWRRDILHSLARVLDDDVLHTTLPSDDPVILLGPGDSAELITRLAIEKRTHRSRKAPTAHITVNRSFDRGRLTRAAGDALCQPAGDFPHGFLDILVDGVQVCQRCADLAARYDLPLPENAEQTTVSVQSKRLRPGDPPVTYRYDSKWSGYNYGIPFGGWLRTWKWIRVHCECAHCGSRIGFRRDGGRVRGMEIFDYYQCEAGCTLADERDLSWGAGRRHPSSASTTVIGGLAADAPF